MQQCPRRTVLGGIGTTMAAALAGSTVATTDADGESASSVATDSTFDDVIGYLPASVAEDSMVVTATDYESLLEADQPYDPRPPVGTLDIDADEISKTVFVTSYVEEYSQPIKVLTGDIELDETTESRETAAGIEYEYYEYEEEDEAVVGTDGEVVIVGGTVETIEAAFDANASEADRLLESEPTVEEGLTVYEGSDARTVQFGQEQLTRSIDEDVDPQYFVNAQTVLDPDTIEVSVGIKFEDESDVTDELVETLEAEFAYAATTEEPTVDVDGSFVSTTVERDLAAERAVQEHDSPGSLRVDRNIDPEADVLEIELGRGDPTPVEDLSFEVDGEEYDREIWADGHGKLEEGDTIVMDMDDVEPNLSVQLHHDHELGGSASGTTILSHFRFRSQFDVDTGELTVEYADDFPLDGDRVFLAAYDERPTYRPNEDAPEPRTSAQPWDGETMSEGDTATLEGVEPDDEIIVGWDGTERQDSIGRVQANPPGTARFEYDYDSETIEVTLEFGDPRDPQADAESEADDTERSATEYELLIDDEPADTQWTDEFDTVSSGATIEADGVTVGSDVEVVWADTGTRIGWTRPRPSIELECDDGTVEHVGGDALPAAELEAQIWAEEANFAIELGDEVDGDFEEGETFAIDAETVTDSDDGIGTVRSVSLQYDDQHRVGYAYPDR